MKQWFWDLKIKHKLLLAFSLLTVFLIGISVTGLYNANSINAHLEKVAKVDLPAIDILLQADRDMQQALVAQRTLIFSSPGTEKFLAMVKENEENIQQVNTRWNKFKELRQADDIQPLIDKFESEKVKWIETTDKIVSKCKEGSPEAREQAITISLTDGSIAFESSREVINQLTELLEKSTDESQLKSEASYNSSFTMMVITTIIAFFIAILAAYTIVKTISEPLNKAFYMMSELSKGKLNARVNPKSKDEVGLLTGAMDTFADKLHGFIKLMYKVADGDLSSEASKMHDDDEISPALNTIVVTLRSLISEAEMLSLAAVEGRLTTRGDENKFNGGYRKIVEGVNNTMEAVITPVNEGVKALEQIATGDLTVRITSNYKGDHQVIKNSINTVAESLDKTISDVNRAIKATSASSNEISSSTEEMAAGAQEQSAQTGEVATAIEEMTKTIIDTTRNAGTAAENAKKAGDIAGEGGKAVEATIEGMQRIAEVVQSSAETVKKLGKSSDEIGEIVQVIDDIADQTNLLALNAAIEAARAGEQGRGFAVVADEVRKLAERTTKATKEIAVMIKQIQADTAEAVDSMSKGTGEVEKGKELAARAGESLQEIIEASVKVVDDISQVASASEEQSSTAEQISKSVESISNVTNETASGIQQVARSAEDLNKLTDNLQVLVSQFRIDKTDRESGYHVRQNGKLVAM